MNLSKRLLHLIFPQKCVLCDSITKDAALWCGCQLPVSPSLCQSCGRTVQHCECKHSFKSSVSPFTYTGNIRKAILLLKHTPHKETLAFFAEHMANQYNGYYKDCNIDYLVPVPMSKTAKRQRGFNQAEILANFLSKKVNLPVNTELLVRRENSVSQHSLGREERYKNADSSYFFAEETRLSPNTTILLVDDIYTTGATLEACSKELLKNGATAVYGVTVAHTYRTQEMEG